MKRAKTVVAPALACFYDRFPLSSTLPPGDCNGQYEQQYGFATRFFPNVPAQASLSGFPNLRRRYTKSARHACGRPKSYIRPPPLERGMLLRRPHHTRRCVHHFSRITCFVHGIVNASLPDLQLRGARKAPSFPLGPSASPCS